MYADPEGELMEGGHLWAVCALNAEYIKTRDQDVQNVDAMFGKKAANKLFARFLYELERPKAWILIYNLGALEVTLVISGGNCPVNSGSCCCFTCILATEELPSLQS
jgi:hypothetical protein